MMDYLIKIFLAVLFGGILGPERTHAGKAAGLRTYMLVTLAAAVFTIISKD
ncbi:MAG: MgtC/SapB family protein [Candidatus Portnoybacteria bacterium]|nr:MgtC/SapB family protein [Candidatus Portnoybacteria bacterium]